MKEKIILDDINNKSLNELKKMASNIINDIESKNDLENTQDDYKLLIQINNIIERKFQFEYKKILLETKEKIEKIKNKKKKWKNKLIK